MHPAVMQAWDPERDDELVCVAARNETHDICSFVFAADPPRRFAFQAGQFLTFDFLIDGRAVPRCYTIASPPTRPERVVITVKRVPGGLVSPWLHTTMRPGVRVRVAGPMGAFCPDPTRPALFLSGGSGITPMMSAARAATDRGAIHDIRFVHAARSPADIIFRAELAGMGLHHAIVCEHDSPGEAWSGYRGRLSLPMLRLIAPDLLQRDVYCCGPAPFMTAVRTMLDEAGFDSARYHQESFDFATLAADAPAVAVEVIGAEVAQTLATFSVRFQKTGRTIDCPADMTVLEAARTAGIRLPSSCTKGVCGTCKSKVVGQVEMRHGGGIRQREIDAGLALLCCSRPLSDLVVDR